MGRLRRWASIIPNRVPLQARALILVALACAVLVALEGNHAWRNRADNLREAQDTNLNLSRSLMMHTEDTIGIAGAVLVSLVERVEREGIWPSSIWDLKQQMAAHVAHSPRISSFALINQDGDLLASSAAVSDPSVSLSSYAYFQHHRTDPSPGIHLDGLVKSHVDGSWIFTVSRRLQHADGSFAGVLLATISSEQLSKHYASFDIGPNGSIGLVHRDGTLLSRHPYDLAQIGRNYARGEVIGNLVPRSPSGRYYSLSQVDGVERVGGYSSGETSPLVIVALSAVDDVLANWRADAANRLVGIGLLAGLLGWFGVRLAQQVS